jgi:hypothetical protein
MMLAILIYTSIASDSTESFRQLLHARPEAEDLFLLLVRVVGSPVIVEESPVEGPIYPTDEASSTPRPS